MNNKKHYPQNKKRHYPQKKGGQDQKTHSITKPFAFDNRTRYQKGLQNQLLSAHRRTETYTKDKAVIITETVDVVDFNNDSFVYEFGNKKVRKNQNNRRRY